MKLQLPEEDLLLQEMTDCLPALYFPENGDDDTIHALARKEFFRVQGLMRLKYDTEEEPGDSNSPFDAVEDEFEQAVYARIRIDPHVIQVVTTRQEIIRKIRETVEKQNNIIGTFYQNRGVHFRHENESGEYDTSPIVVIHNPGYHSYGGYEVNTVYELFIDSEGKLLCTLNGEAGEDFDEPIEHIQIEGLIEIAHWLQEQGFIESDTAEQKYAAWQRISRHYFDNDKVEIPPADPLRCNVCGSLHVECRKWSDVNTGEEAAGDDAIAYRCTDCDNENVALESEYIQRVEEWWDYADLNEKQDISGLQRINYQDDKQFEEACLKFWNDKTSGQKIDIWREQIYPES